MSILILQNFQALNEDLGLVFEYIYWGKDHVLVWQGVILIIVAFLDIPIVCRY